MVPADLLILEGSDMKSALIIGAGLMGGSLALALKSKAGFERVLVMDTQPDTALWEAAGLIAGTLQDLPMVDLLVLATPIQTMAPILTEAALTLCPHTLIMDLASTKSRLIESVRPILGAHLSRFVPTHPICGKETSGFCAAEATLFQDQPVIVTPLPHETDPEALSQIKQLWQTLGARVFEMSPNEHDAAYGKFSHLSNLLSFLLKKQETTPPQLSGDLLPPSFKAMTHLADSSPVMWRDICLSNPHFILEALSQFEGDLKHLKHLIEVGDKDTLLHWFHTAGGSSL